MLTKHETEILKNTDFFVFKHSAIKKIKHEFASLHIPLTKLLEPFCKKHFPNVFLDNLKISGGENHNGLPWIAADLPMISSSENFIAFRTLFWWGKYFSVNIVAKGKNAQVLNKLLQHEKSKKGIFVTFSKAGIWNNDFGHEDYKELPQPLNSGNIEYIRIGRKIELEQSNQLKDVILNNYSDLLKLFLSANGHL